jgi:RNA polymerase sigma factor (sigma-70 family)
VTAFSPAARDALRRGFERGRTEYGPLPIAFAAYEAHVVAAATRHWAALALAPSADRLAEHVASGAMSDLYLAAACDAGSPGAWEVLAERLRPRLEGFAVRRGLASNEAEARVQDLLGDLALPPPRGGARTLLATYDGSGSFFGWLCVVLLRRIAGAARSRKPVSLDARPAEDVDASVPVGAGRPAPDPATEAVGAEQVARFDGALAHAWAGLRDQERLALLLKHRDGLRQRQIATLLGVGEPRVSRIVAAAVERLRAGLAGVFGAIARPDEATDPAALAAAVARLLARNPSPARPTGAGDRDRDVG